MTSSTRLVRRRSAVVLLAASLGFAACGADDAPGASDAPDVTIDAPATTASASTVIATQPSSGAAPTPLVASDYLGDYTLANEDFGTMVTVTVAEGVRTIETNALPDHETGEFPNAGNPNTITEQDLTWTFPVEPVMTGTPTEVRVTGVAVNGVKFEPGTAETMECATGEQLRIEALQDMYDLGFDFNNAHVQPNGEYHYHGIAELLVDAHSSGNDLVLLGFAADGNFIYFSTSGAYRSGYSLSTELRTGTDCTASLRNASPIDLDGTTPDGTYTSDWVWSADTGELDECNGTTVDGQYAYFITDEYPFIPRCLMGEFTESAPTGPPPGP